MRSLDYMKGLNDGIKICIRRMEAERLEQEKQFQKLVRMENRTRGIKKWK